MNIIYSLCTLLFMNTCFAQGKISEVSHVDFISSIQDQMKYKLSYFDQYSDVITSEMNATKDGVLHQSRRIEIKELRVVYNSELLYRKSDSLIFSYSQVLNGDTVGGQIKKGLPMNYNPLKLEDFIFYNNCSMNINWSEKYPFLMFLNETED